jgi:predicted DNA-binding protein with PD1-like motif
MKVHTFRLKPGNDLKAEIEKFAKAKNIQAGFIIKEEEVERVKWFTRVELTKELQEYPEKYLKGLEWPLENL